MFRILILLLLTATSAFAEIPNHKNVVTAARAKYDKLPPGRLRAYCIVNETVYVLRGEGAGLFFKTGDSSFADRSSDIIIYKPNAETFDILGDAENKAVPAWGRTTPTGFGPIAKWRAPLDPATITACKTAQPPDPPDPPDPQPPDDLTLRVAALEGAVSALQAHTAVIDKQIAALTQRVAVLEIPAVPPLPPPCTPTEVDTSRSLGHTHKVKTCQ